MLAEGDKPYLSRSGFDAVYPWDMFHMMIKIAEGEWPAFALDSVKTYADTAFAPNEIQMYFTRGKKGNKVLVILNLSSNQQAVTVTDKKMWGKLYNVFMGISETLNGKPWMIEPWGYVVYTYAVGSRN